MKVNRGARGQQGTGRLVTSGPYAWVRHPLYLGSLVIGAGFCVVVQNPWLAAAGLAGFLWSYRAKMIEEESLLLQECGPAYARYHAAVPQLLPCRRRYDQPAGRWSWAGLRASKEWRTALWLFVMSAGLYFWEELVQQREPLFGHQPWLRAVLIGLIILLAGGDITLELIRLRRQAASGA